MYFRKKSVATSRKFNTCGDFCYSLNLGITERHAPGSSRSIFEIFHFDPGETVVAKKPDTQNLKKNHCLTSLICFSADS